MPLCSFIEPETFKDFGHGGHGFSQHLGGMCYGPLIKVFGQAGVKHCRNE